MFCSVFPFRSVLEIIHSTHHSHALNSRREREDQRLERSRLRFESRGFRHQVFQAARLSGARLASRESPALGGTMVGCFGLRLALGALDLAGRLDGETKYMNLNRLWRCWKGRRVEGGDQPWSTGGERRQAMEQYI